MTVYALAAEMHTWDAEGLAVRVSARQLAQWAAFFTVREEVRETLRLRERAEAGMRR